MVIKAYPDGNVSAYIDKLKVGDEISVKGPFAKIKYEPNMKKSIGMIGIINSIIIYNFIISILIHSFLYKLVVLVSHQCYKLLKKY